MIIDYLNLFVELKLIIIKRIFIEDLYSIFLHTFILSLKIIVSL